MIHFRRLSNDDILAELRVFEQRHGMTSAVFYDRYRAGEMGDGREMVQWAILCSIATRAGLLGGSASWVQEPAPLTDAELQDPATWDFDTPEFRPGRDVPTTIEPELLERIYAIMARPYGFMLTPLPTDEGGGWFIHVPDLPGCMSDGATPDEALVHIREAMEGWLAVALEKDDPIPEPSPITVFHVK